MRPARALCSGTSNETHCGSAGRRGENGRSSTGAGGKCAATAGHWCAGDRIPWGLRVKVSLWRRRRMRILGLTRQVAMDLLGNNQPAAAQQPASGQSQQAKWWGLRGSRCPKITRRVSTPNQIPDPGQRMASASATSGRSYGTTRGPRARPASTGRAIRGLESELRGQPGPGACAAWGYHGSTYYVAALLAGGFF